MLIGGFLLSTSVSFASDVPQTTKECVIDNAFDMESNVVISEVSLSFERSDVLLTVTHIPSVITMSAYNDTLEQFALLNRINVDTRFNRHYRPISIHGSNYTKNKLNRIAFKFIDKNCRTRELTNA